MSYVLVRDDCECCQYVLHAFTFLRLPLETFSFEELLDHSDKLSDPVSIIACKNIENQNKTKLYKFLIANQISLISFNEPKSHPNELVSVFYLKPSFSHYDLQDALSRSIHHHEPIGNIDHIKYPVFEKLIGESEAITKVKSMIKQVADSDTTVLLMGQSGTGKDVIASCIHYLSNRRGNALVPINCGAIPSELIESELFGHEKGAFTGALTRREGRFEMANAGTIFLDEIGDMPMPMQVKLLRVIQDRKIQRVGGNNNIDVDVRIITATNKNLEELIQQNHFREDLFYRINVFPIQVPSLNERRDDIPPLIDYHLEKIYNRLKHRVVFTSRAKQLLCDYPWPGNVRELQNFLERMVILHPDCSIDEKDIDIAYKQKKLPISQATSSLLKKDSFDIKDYLAKIEVQIIEDALHRSNGEISAAAKALSLKVTTLKEKMKKLKLKYPVTESV